jgi:YegS/Rv2252/BmrU family lipid kinase
MKLLLLVNPISGKGKNRQIAQKIIESVNRQGWECQIKESLRANYFQEMLPNFELQTFSHIGVVGGDGTMHDVLNGLMTKPDAQHLPVVLFPCGSGNAFNHDLDCLSIDKAIDRLLANQTRRVDMIQLTASDRTLWSFNIVGFGLVSKINEWSEANRWLGAMRYTMMALVGIFFNPIYKATVQVDNESFEGDFCFVLVCNTIHTGKAMKIAPLAKLSDGLLDVLVVRHLPIWRLLVLFPKIFTGTHLSAKELIYRQAKSIKIIPQKKQIGNIDGEVTAYTPYQMQVVPNKLNIIC